MNFCPECGNEFKETDTFCINCGFSKMLANTTSVGKVKESVFPAQKNPINSKTETEFYPASSQKDQILSPHNLEVKRQIKFYKSWWFWEIILIAIFILSEDKEVRVMLIFPIGLIIAYHAIYKTNSWGEQYLGKFLQSNKGKWLLVLLGILLFLIRIIIGMIKN